MKTRIIVFLGISAIATLSFTFVSVTKEEKAKVSETTSVVQSHNNEPIGGFLSEDKF